MPKCVACVTSFWLSLKQEAKRKPKARNTRRRKPLRNFLMRM